MRRNPLYRALRVDKMTLAALDVVLAEHEAGRAERTVPVLRMLGLTGEEIRARAEALRPRPGNHRGRAPARRRRPGQLGRRRRRGPDRRARDRARGPHPRYLQRGPARRAPARRASPPVVARSGRGSGPPRPPDRALRVRCPLARSSPRRRALTRPSPRNLATRLEARALNGSAAGVIIDALMNSRGRLLLSLILPLVASPAAPQEVSRYVGAVRFSVDTRQGFPGGFLVARLQSRDGAGHGLRDPRRKARALLLLASGAAGARSRAALLGRGSDHDRLRAGLAARTPAHPPRPVPRRPRLSAPGRHHPRGQAGAPGPGQRDAGRPRAPVARPHREPEAGAWSPEAAGHGRPGRGLRGRADLARQDPRSSRCSTPPSATSTGGSTTRFRSAPW